ncbi:ribosomal RNA processing protein 1 homolog B isoform X2 [Hemicordylus capensis]|uniref:ribosomal RNA processing protein 1 homolog B isoform X2 n=1 Tax=Hemicordylus capensis TaxID=884348 RepID=UPI00230408DC|nr:ribosomal RNA processing protein 1 homolog B isoform X2 [Hemicordylus capensis]
MEKALPWAATRQAVGNRMMASKESMLSPQGLESSHFRPGGRIYSYRNPAVPATLEITTLCLSPRAAVASFTSVRQSAWALPARGGALCSARAARSGALWWIMAPAADASAVQPLEIQFAQRLAANEKKIRDRALKKLRAYITLRTRSPKGGFSHEELLKIWKGLFYCMWMQDKPLLQEELSNNISQLVHVIENMEARHLFIQTFWQTMSREWNGVDRLRLDKFYMLMRMVLRQCFEVLKRNGWNESFTEPFLNLLMKEIVHSDSTAPIGIKLHFIDIYLEELAKVGAKELTADQNLRFIEPFCKIIAKTKNHAVLQAIIRGIFETIVDQSPFAIEDLMKELKAGSDDGMSEEDEWSDEESQLMAKDRSLPSKPSFSSEAQEHFLGDADDNIGPVLQFDYKMVADKLFELASRKNTPVFNRKRIYKVVKKFQDLGEGTFPQDDFPEDVSTDEDDEAFSRKKWKRKSGKPLNKTKLEKEANATNGEIGVEEHDDKPRLKKKRRMRKRKSSQTAVDTCTTVGSNEKVPAKVVEYKELNQDSESANAKKRPRKCSSVEANEIDSPASSTAENCALKTLTCLVSNIKKGPKKKSCNLQKVPAETVLQNGQTCTQEGPGCCVSVEPDSKMIKKKCKTKSGIITGNCISEEESPAELDSTVLQKVKLKKKHKLRNLKMIRSSKQKIVTLKKKRKIKEVLNSVENNELETAKKKKKNSETVGTAILKKKKKKKKAKAGNDLVKFEKTTLPKPVFFRKAKGSITSMKGTKDDSCQADVPERWRMKEVACDCQMTACDASHAQQANC